VASLKDVGERALVDRVIKGLRRGACLGPGDDAACIDANGVRIAISTDIVSFDRHLVKGASMESFGWLAAAVSFSDIASMGARPLGILAAVSLPPETDENVLYDIMHGVDQRAEFCGAEVLGGDTKPGCGSVCGTAVGVCEHEVLTRGGASVGDLVAVTGSLGSASAGWHAALNGIRDKKALSATMLPVPRVKEGALLSKSGAATACMDVSDGLSTTATAICARSGVGMDIIWESLPKGDGVDGIAKKINVPTENMMLNGGGDYELMFTFRKENLSKLNDLDIDFTVIGGVTRGGVNLIRNGNIEPMENRGYEHFTEG
jgi:thiamine-monophosphate kinase